MRQFLFLLVLVSIALSVSSAPVLAQNKKKKKKKQNTSVIGKTYHDMTARYNTYFNAKLIFTEALQKLKASNKDDYKQLLSLYTFSGGDKASSVQGDMDIIIKKASKAIDKHSVSKWIDDAYLIMGQAYYFKGDFETAKDNFQYIGSKFGDDIRMSKKKKSSSSNKKKSSSKKKKKKKKKTSTAQKKKEAAKAKAKAEKAKSEKPNFSRYGILRHQPAKYESMVWLARTYLDDGELDKAFAVMEFALNDKTFPKQLADDLYMLYAHYYVLQEKETAAYDQVKNAIGFVRKKKDRARLHYILGQIDQGNEQYADALKSFKKVIKSKPLYEMEFNARLNIASTKLLSGDFSAEQADRYLSKMLKDDKNIDYLDQIYFSKGEIALADGDLEKAFEFFKLAASSSTINQEQKAYAFLRVADLYYEHEEFTLASAYYDSTLTFLTKDYKDYEEITLRRDVLTELVVHISTVEMQDSLQRLARLPERDRNEIIDAVIAQLEEQMAEVESDNTGGDITNNQPITNSSSNNQGTWYFYNQGAKGKGFNEFQSNWGKRPLEDNWRRSSRQSTGSFTAEVDTSSSVFEIQELVKKGELTRDFFIAQLPSSKEDFDLSNEKIQKALFEIGNIYKNKLKNEEKAAIAYEELVKRFPDTEYAPQTHYVLYLIYQNDNNATASIKHKNTVLNKYPDSSYAELIKDPDFANKAKQKDKELVKYYEDTYLLYEAEKYSEVLKRKQDAEVLFASSTSMQPQFDLLAAFVIGKTKERDEYIIALKEIVNTHPDHEVKIKAEEILKVIDKKFTPAATNNDSPFKVDKSIRHYFIIVFDEYTENLNTVVNKLSDHNKANNSLDKLKVTQMLLTPQNQIIMVKNFDDAEKAMAYHKAIKADEATFFNGVVTKKYKVFAISKTNFTQFFKDKDSEAYYQFFQNNY